MNIVTWNCNGALSKKFHTLDPLRADIHIIQECENPEISHDAEYRKWAANSIWIGTRESKGLGVFAKNNIRIRKLNWISAGLNFFIACKVNNDFILLAAWCHMAKTYSYIGQLWKYIQLHKSKLKNIVIAGDLNSNTFWDRPRRSWNHTEVVRELEQLKIVSLYHRFFQESQGGELQPTFYLYRNRTKPYHIDYIFASEGILGSIIAVKVGRPDDWLSLSDHMPVISELQLK